MYIKSEIKRHKNETDKINGPSRSDMKPRFVALNFQNHSFHITKSTSFPGSLFSAFLGRWKKESFCKKSKGGRGERLWERGWLQNLVAICNLSTGINLAWKLPHQNGVKNWEPEICTIIIHMYSCFFSVAILIEGVDIEECLLSRVGGKFRFFVTYTTNSLNRK